MQSYKSLLRVLASRTKWTFLPILRLLPIDVSIENKLFLLLNFRFKSCQFFS